MMIYYILTFVMGVAVGALLLIRSYEKNRTARPRLRCPEAADDKPTQSNKTAVDAPAKAKATPAIASANNAPSVEPAQLTTAPTPPQLAEAAKSSEQIEPNLGHYAPPLSTEQVSDENTISHSSANAGGLIRAAKQVLVEEQVSEPPLQQANQTPQPVDQNQMYKLKQNVTNQSSSTTSVTDSQTAVDLHSQQDSPTIEPASEVVTLYLRAPRQMPYNGYELLQALLSLGLRIGSRQIFHCYQDMHANKKIMFSIARAHQPGTFQIEKMGGQRFRGLVLFMSPDLGLYNIIPFEQMLRTAKSLQEELGGDLLDHRHSELTFESLQNIRAQLRQQSSEEDVMPVRTPDNPSLRDEHESSQ